MTPRDVLIDAVDPACLLLARLHPLVQSDDRARALLLTIAGQETGWAARRQLGGPARSLWQFELGGGVWRVMNRMPTAMMAVCNWCLIPYSETVIFEAMAWHDVLAASMARLLLWVDPAPLPPVGDARAGWEYYERCWAPGLPRPETWPGHYSTALAAMGH